MTITYDPPTLSAMESFAELAPGRLETVHEQMRVRGVDVVLLYAIGTGESAGHLRYLVGWMPTTSEAVLVLRVDGSPTLIANDKNRARAFAGVCGRQLEVMKSTDLWGDVARVLGSLPVEAQVGTVGAFDLTRSALDRLDTLVAGRRVLEFDEVITTLRAERSPAEEASHRSATRVADAMVQRAMVVASTPGASGIEIMTEVEALGRRMGADVAKCWLAIGRAPAETYFETFEMADRVQWGDRVQIGTTVMHHGYFSQVLRIGVLGDPSRELVDIAARLIDMQDCALEAMKVGEPVTAIGDVLEDMIDQTCPYQRSADPFRFQSCHALGNSYSEPWSAPFLHADRSRSHDHESPRIAPHQTYEIHPNFTMPGLGHVCTGDVAVVGEQRATWMSTTPRGLIPLG